MALCYTDLEREHREILLKNKPAAMLQASPKGTVPILVLPNGQVIDESLDIMYWALSQKDDDQWIPEDQEQQDAIKKLIRENDNSFKQHLDRYKYADRFPEHPQEFYRAQGELFLHTLEERLSKAHYLMGEKMTLADAAIAPFIRQFAHVDREWFYQSSYPNLIRWLKVFLESELFAEVMVKHPLWVEES